MGSSKECKDLCHLIEVKYVCVQDVFISFSVIQNYIFTDLRSRTDLAFAWLYQEYANCMNFNSVAVDGKQNMASYDECLTRLLNGIMEFKDNFREG